MSSHSINDQMYQNMNQNTNELINFDRNNQIVTA